MPADDKEIYGSDGPWESALGWAAFIQRRRVTEDELSQSEYAKWVDTHVAIAQTQALLTIGHELRSIRDLLARKAD